MGSFVTIWTMSSHMLPEIYYSGAIGHTQTNFWNRVYSGACIIETQMFLKKMRIRNLGAYHLTSIVCTWIGISLRSGKAQGSDWN